MITKKFNEIFSKIEDPHRRQGLRVDLWQMLGLCVLSYMAGYTGYRGIHRFGCAHKEILVKTLGLRHGIPSYVTIRYLLVQLRQEDLMQAFCEWSMQLEGVSGEWYSGDGKTLGSTVKNVFSTHQSFEGVVSIFAQKSGLVKCLGSYRNEEKEKGESHVARVLIDHLDGMGVVFCFDALHTQKKQ